jgi:hypothetical protein
MAKKREVQDRIGCSITQEEEKDHYNNDEEEE